MIINHNLPAMNTYRQMSTNAAAAANSMSKLSSGLRINRAGDDAAGLAISEKMRAQIRGLDQASRNAQDGISMVQTAEGGLNEVHSILQRMRELADQSANGTNTADDRKSISDEVTQLKNEIDRIGNTTEFNTQKLLNGSLKSAAGASIGQNVTTGAQVGKLAAASVTATSAMTGATLVTGDFVKETLTIDGTNIEVNWQDLTSEQKQTITAGTGSSATAQSKNAAADLIVQTINNAIDNSGKNVAHISGYVDGTGKLVLKSGSEGTDSQIKTASSVASIAGKSLFSAGETGVTGTNKYNGSNIASGVSFNLEVNGQLIGLATLGAAINNGDAMSSAASTLQTALNNAITAYNGATGKASNEDGYIAQVTVAASKDGRLTINSETGPVVLSDKTGATTIKDLGLSSAQTEASGGGGMTFQIGANRGQSISFGINDMRSAALGIASIDVSTATGASQALTSLDNAIKTVSSERSKLGAVQNRLEHTINNLNTSSENLTSAESRIRDVDMAKEMMQMTKNNILNQAAQAMLAQANQAPQGVLQLLR
ncbi:flagellin [Heliophilum fasciatum]|uniref:Flagellin n=1 Tax=Heliophilum fasciatum TaxID=35700 RepID=A0A4R2RMD7_9FIRM|nr:flagellin [Heliophilum fasciatum]MCW2278816.1 flagellin [Heliophilum fasciatum]TCP64098.1 flagellin [Heliophilum fasciatum]